MERRVQVFHSFEDAERAEDEYYASLTPQQRVDLLLELIAAHHAAQGTADVGLVRVRRVIKLADS